MKREELIAARATPPGRKEEGQPSGAPTQVTQPNRLGLAALEYVTSSLHHNGIIWQPAPAPPAQCAINVDHARLRTRGAPVPLAAPVDTRRGPGPAIMGREEVMESTRYVSDSVCWLCYAATLATIVFMFLEEERLPYNDKYWNGFLIHSASTVTIFCFSFVYSNTSLYDPAWCILPIAMGAGWMLTGEGSPSTRGLIAWALLWIWFARYNISWPWDGWVHGIKTEDWRYIETAKVTGSGTPLYWLASLFSLHLTPTWLVFFALGPVEKVWTRGGECTLGMFDFIGVEICVLAVSIQVSARTVYVPQTVLCR